MRKSRLVQHLIDNDQTDRKFTGTILWFRERDGYGIIKESEVGHEIYVDVSVLPNREAPAKGATVSFAINTKITECACACNVSVL